MLEVGGGILETAFDRKRDLAHEFDGADLLVEVVAVLYRRPGADAEHALAPVDVDVLGTYAGKGRLDDDVAVGLVDVDGHRLAPARMGGGGTRHLHHLLEQVAHRARLVETPADHAVIGLRSSRG